jgi:hypothetical protein
MSALGQFWMSVNSLSIEDAVLSACCARGFAVERQRSEETLPTFPILRVGEDGAFRFHDYRVPWRKRLSRQSSHYVHQLPVSPTRLALAELLTVLVYRWVVLHEQAHWLAGHLDHLIDLRHTRSLSLSEARSASHESANTEASIIDRCLELQADSVATQLFITQGLEDAWLQRMPAAQLYTERLLQLDPHGTNVSPRIHERLPRLRLLLLAAGIACLLFEVRRQKSRTLTHSHPSPSARLINVCATTLSSFGDIAHVEAGREVQGDVYVQLKPVDAYPGERSPYGLVDTVGNAGDWVVNESSSYERIYMGATYRFNPEDATAFRMLPVTEVDAFVREITVRCVSDVSPQR